MELTQGVHQLRVDFSVTPEVKRYVYLYLILGQGCYLIDSGVAGSEEVVARYLEALGRPVSQLRGIFLTHAHPDHIGGAAALRRLSGCKIYASAGERPWIEDIDRQFQARPIPNFYGLVGEGVPVDCLLAPGDRLALEPGLTVEVIGTPGHSAGGLSFLLSEKELVFTGDAIPAPGDIPIYEDKTASLETLERLRALAVKQVCPAWDRVYSKEESLLVIDQGRDLICRIQQAVDELEGAPGGLDQLVAGVCARLGLEGLGQNPLFRRTVACHRTKTE